MQDKTQNPLLTAFRKLVTYAKAEPVALQGVIQAGIALLVGFGVFSWTSEQTGLTLALSAAILTLLARRQVSPSKAPAPPAGDRAGRHT